MSWIIVDQRESKAAAIGLMKELGNDSSEEMINRCIYLVMEQSKEWNINHSKLRPLLYSQIRSGNTSGAIKVIESAIKDQRFRLIPGLFFAIILWPFRFIGSILSLGFRK